MTTKIKLFCLLFFCVARYGSAQKKEDTNIPKNIPENIPIAVLVPAFHTKGLSDEARNFLDNKLTLATNVSGIGELLQNDDYSFILYPSVTNITKDVLPGAPTLYAYNIDVNLYVVNGTLVDSDSQKKGAKAIMFASTAISLKGVGTSETQAYIKAFRNLNTSDPRLTTFIKDTRLKIYKYFADNCDAIIMEASQLVKEASLSMNNDKSHERSAIAELQFAQGINLLKNIRIANTACYQKNTKTMDGILEMYDQFACNYYLSMAKNSWYILRDFELTKQHLDNIPPSLKCKSEVESLLKSIQSEKTSEKAFIREIERWNNIDSYKREFSFYENCVKSIYQHKKNEVISHFIY